MKLVITVPVQTKACKVEQEKHSPKQKLSTLTTPTSKIQTAETPRKTENTPKTTRSRPVQPIVMVDEDFK